METKQQHDAVIQSLLWGRRKQLNPIVADRTTPQQEGKLRLANVIAQEVIKAIDRTE